MCIIVYMYMMIMVTRHYEMYIDSTNMYKTCVSVQSKIMSYNHKSYILLM